MDEGMQLTAKLPGMKKGIDSSKQVFSILDDISATFKKELESAQSRDSQKAKSALPLAKATPKDQKPGVEKSEKEPEPQAEEAGVVSEDEAVAAVAKELLKDESEAETSIEDDEVSLEGVQITEIVVDSDSTEVTPLEAPLESSSEEIALEDTTLVEEPLTESPAVVVGEESPPEGVEASPLPLDEAASTAQTVSEETEISTDTEIEPPEEKVKVTQTPPQEASRAPVSTETVTQPEQVVLIESPRQVEAPMEESGEEITEEAESAIQAQKLSARASEPQKLAEGITPERPRKDADLKSQEIEVEAPDLEIESQAEAEEVREDFHNLQSDDSVVIQLDAEETAHILKGLDELAQASQVQAPNPAKVSDQILESLKTSNPNLARQVESLKTPGGEAAILNRLETGAQAEEGAASRSQGSRFPNQRLEDLKNKIVQQVRFQLKTELKGKTSEVRMQLHPKYLGKVKVKLVLEANTAKANFIVETHTVREMLQRSVASLEEALGEHGVDVSSVEITVSEDNAGQGEGGRSFQSMEDQEAVRSFLGSFRRWEEEEVEEDAPVASSEDSDGGLNIMA